MADNGITISGTVTITLEDYAKLHRLANKGRRTLALHEQLLVRVSQCLSDIVYEPTMENKQAEIVVAKVRALARSMAPDLEFRHDADNKRIIVRIPDEAV